CRDASDFVVGELCERANVPRRRDDDLMVIEDGVEVRNHSDSPSRRVGCAAARSDRERLRRRSVLAALAERAREQVVLGRQVEVGARARAGSLGPPGCDDDPLSRNWVLAKLAGVAQLEAPPSLARNGESKSIGAGKTIVVDCDEPS